MNNLHFKKLKYFIYKTMTEIQIKPCRYIVKKINNNLLLTKMKTRKYMKK